MRDWNQILDNPEGFLAASTQKTVCRRYTATAEIFSAFIRGQFAVILSLAMLKTWHGRIPMQTSELS